MELYFMYPIVNNNMTAANETQDIINDAISIPVILLPFPFRVPRLVLYALAFHPNV